MTFRLMFLNLFRKKIRTFLTIFGVAVALFLFCFLEAVLSAFKTGVNMADASRLVVQQKEAITFTLPMSYESPITQVEGVRRVAHGMWFGGMGQEQRPGGEKKEEFFANFAVDIEPYLDIYPEILVPKDQLLAVMNDQKACIIGSKLAERLGKKLGDHMTLRGTIWSKPDGPIWEFNIRAIYTSSNKNFDQTMMIFHFKYFDEARDVEKGRAGFYVIALKDPSMAPEVSAKIDQRFSNSPSETRTMTEKAFNSTFLSMMGNLELLFRSIGSAVVLTMLLVSANTMMMSARDRTRDMGILKALGFTDQRVFMLLIGEAILIAFIGAIIGVGGSWTLFNLGDFNPKPDFFPVFKIPTPSLWMAFGIAAGTGLISGLIPGIVALRLKPTEALKSV